MKVLIALALALPLTAQQRIVSTAPGITETLFALGLGSRVVGVSNFCHYPPEVKSIAKVGMWLQPNVEVIASLKPDLVFVSKLPTNRTPDQLRRLNIRVAEIEHGNLDETLAAWEQIAREAGVADRGRALTAKTRASLATLRAKAAPLPKRSLVFVVGRTPARLEGMFAVGRGGFLNDLITLAGGRNVFGDSPLEYPKIALETIVAMKPDVVIDMGDMAETTGATVEQTRATVGLWRKPVPKSRVYAVASDLFVVPGPRIVEAANAFAAMLHPEFHQ